MGLVGVVLARAYADAAGGAACHGGLRSVFGRVQLVGVIMSQLVCYAWFVMLSSASPGQHPPHLGPFYDKSHCVSVARERGQHTCIKALTPCDLSETIGGRRGAN